MGRGTVEKREDAEEEDGRGSSARDSSIVERRLELGFFSIFTAIGISDASSPFSSNSIADAAAAASRDFLLLSRFLSRFLLSRLRLSPVLLRVLLCGCFFSSFTSPSPVPSTSPPPFSS